MRFLMLILGHLCLVLGLIGIPLPILPTTPFLLLAAFFYSRVSGRFHDWLQNHHRLGPSIRAWQNHGVIRPRAKFASTLLILISLLFPLFFGEFGWDLKLIALCTAIAVLAFIHTRPGNLPAVAPEPPPNLALDPVRTHAASKIAPSHQTPSPSRSAAADNYPTG